MADTPLPERPQPGSEDLLRLDKDLERIEEDAENISVQLTWMTYDMVVLRTSPELAASMQKLQGAHQRCRAVVGGGPDQGAESSTSPRNGAVSGVLTAEVGQLGFVG